MTTPSSPDQHAFFPEGTVEYDLTAKLRDTLKAASEIAVPTTPDELWNTTRFLTGMEIPRVAVCPGHTAPFSAYSHAFFADSPICVWLASRGFGGKSVLLATLSMVEAITLGAAVNLLGGSGEQAQRVHGYMVGEDTNLPHKFWGYKNAPNRLLINDPTKKETRLSNDGRIQVLMASQTSVRGPHPQRLRLDEIDEMDIDLFDAAMGQPMAARGIKEQVVASSTHQYPDGTMTEVLRRSKRKGWPVFEWCYKETLQGWLTQDQIERKKAVVTSDMWNTEYDLQEPASHNRAIDTASLSLCFNRKLANTDGRPPATLEFEPPHPNGLYVTAADWAKKSDLTVVLTFRVDIQPMRLVAYRAMNRLPWPVMVKEFEKQATLYYGDAIHDSTGLGDVVDDYLTIDAYPVILAGRFRQDLMSNYIAAIEGQKLEFPYVEYLYNEHKFMTNKDVYSPSGHPPDTFIAGCLAWYLGGGGGGWTRGAG